MAADTLPESVERELQKLVMRYRIKGDSLIDLARDCARLGLRDAPDTGRLDWLESSSLFGVIGQRRDEFGESIGPLDRSNPHYEPRPCEVKGATLRAAIDAAMAQAGGQEDER